MERRDSRVPVPLSGLSSGPAGRLPPKLVEDAASRLAWLALVTAVTIPIIQVFQRMAQPVLAPIILSNFTRLATLAAVLVSIGVFALHRFKLVLPSTLVRLGLVLEVIVALCISMIETLVPPQPNAPVLGISSLGPWIVAVGVFIPNRPIVTLMAGLAAATTWPLAYAVNAYRLDYPPVPLGQLLVWPMFNYLIAILTFLIGRRLYGMTLAAETATELGSYRLVSPIGEGGMGEVWRASHRMLMRAAAIKLIRPQLIDASARQADVSAKRFRREANIIAGLQSPHTVYLYDFGVSADGRFYYVMELLDGISLQNLIATFGPQPASRVIPLLTQICRSLEEAHEQGLVHRDLKPSNVMACKVALRYDFVKVLDFGLAKLASSDEVTQLTMEGIATGTPGYIAPEVARGDRAVDGRADIYALGCVAYFLLTGTLVFNEANPMTMALKHVQATPDPPSSRTELPIPPALEQLVLRCLEKNPADRPQSAAEFADLLDACDVPTWTAADAERWWLQHLPATSTLRSFEQPAVATPALVSKA